MNDFDITLLNISATEEKQGHHEGLLLSLVSQSQKTPLVDKPGVL